MMRLSTAVRVAARWLLVLAAAGALTGAHAAALPGDVDGDGQITLSDAQQSLRLALGLAPITPDTLARVDLFPPGHPDGRIDVRDTMVLLQAIVSLGPKLDSPALSAYLANDPTKPIPDLLMVLAFKGSVPDSLFLGDPGSSSPTLSQPIQWTGSKKEAMAVSSRDNAVVIDLLNPYSFYVTATPDVLPQLANCPDVGRILLAPPDAPPASLPSGLTQRQLAHLYKAALISFLPMGDPYAFIAVDTRSLVGLTPASKQYVIQSLAGLARGVMDADPAVLQVAGLAQTQPTGLILQGIPPDSRPGVLLTLRATLPDGAPVPTGQIVVEEWLGSQGRTDTAFDAMPIPNNDYTVGPPSLIGRN